MKKQLLALFFGAVVITASAGVSALDTDLKKAEVSERTISPEDQQRFTERFKSVEAASKAQADMASEGAEEANPVCEVVLCMFGKMAGKSQSKCKSAEKKYFKILVTGKKGRPSWGKTATARLNFLNGCPSPENKNINAKFGKVFG